MSGKFKLGTSAFNRRPRRTLRNFIVVRRVAADPTISIARQRDGHAIVISADLANQRPGLFFSNRL
jgi:hypothetical protein